MRIAVEHRDRSIAVELGTSVAALGVFFWVSLIGAPFAQAECIATPALEARVHDNPDVNVYTDLGTWFAQQQQFECANQAFREALKLDPSSAKLNYFLGLSLYSSHQAEGAIAPLQQSIQSDAKAIQPRILLATVFVGLGRKDDAETQWKAALQIDPTSTDALDGMATLLTDGGNPMAAVALLKPAQRDEDLNIDLARAYGQAGMLDEAAVTVKDALAADPSSLRLTNALATVYVNQHRYQDAATLLHDFVQQYPDDLDAQVFYLRALVLNSNTTEARPLAKKLLAALPHNFDVLLQNGMLERQAGDYTAARDHLRETVALQPQSYDALYNLGAALAHLNDAAGAKEQLEKAIALDSSQAEAHFQLASVLRTLSDTQGAQEQLKVYQQLNRASEARSEANTKSQLAAQKLAAGDAQQAISLYRDAIAATPDDALLNYKLAVALDKAGDFADERRALEQAVKLDPTFAVAQNQLGYLLSRDGSAGANAAAEEHFRLAVKAAPEFAVAWINLAATLGAEAHYPEAQEAVATALRLDPKNSDALQLSQQLNAAMHH
jgi:tetratricopeptide (TPR) repeat protein